MNNNLSLAFMNIPCLYIIAGLLVSMYHGYRGYVLQRWTEQSQKSLAEHSAENENRVLIWMTSVEAIIVRHLYDALLQFVCSVLGFCVLWLFIFMFNTLPNIYDISGGTGAMMAFLGIIGLLGVTGLLPYVIQLGKFPR